MPGAAGDGGVRHEAAEQIREGRVGPREQGAEDQQQNRGHRERAQHRAHVASGAAEPFPQASPAPDGSGEYRGVQADRAEQHSGPGTAAVQRERARGHGGHHGEEGRPVGVTQRRHGQQGEAADAPHQRPAPRTAAGRLGGEVRGERGRNRHQQEVQGQSVGEQEHAQYAGGQGGPEGGGADRCRGLRLKVREPPGGLGDRVAPVDVLSVRVVLVGAPFEEASPEYEAGTASSGSSASAAGFLVRAAVRPLEAPPSERSPALRSASVPSSTPGFLGSASDGLSDTGPPPDRSTDGAQHMAGPKPGDRCLVGARPR